MTAAEESTAWPMVSRPLYVGGLGFGFKWNMGWMHDTLQLHVARPDPPPLPPQRPDLRPALRLHENFILPLSHDEVVHGKGSLIGKHAGRPLAEIRQSARLFRASCGRIPARSCCSWAASSRRSASGTTIPSLDWHSARRPDPSPACSGWCATSTGSTATAPALHQLDCEPDGFDWIDAANGAESVLSFVRRGRDPQRLRGHRRAISRRCRGTTTASACRGRAAMASAQHRRRRSTAAATSATAASVASRAASDARPRPIAAPAHCRRSATLHPARRESSVSRPSCHRRRVWPGQPVSRSARPGTARGVNFALFSAHAEKVELCLFDRSGSTRTSASSCPSTPTRCGTAICPRRGRDSSTAIASTAPTTRARATASTRTSCCSTPTPGDRRAVALERRACSAIASAARATTSPSTAATAPASCRNAGSSRPPSPGATTGTRAPRGPRRSSTRCMCAGFTIRHPDVPSASAAPSPALASPAVIDYLVGLGVTAVELLPVHASVDDRHLIADAG